MSENWEGCYIYEDKSYPMIFEYFSITSDQKVHAKGRDEVG